MENQPKFTHIAIERLTQRKISLLATVLDQTIYELVAEWAEEKWKLAKQAGLVKDAMLEPEPAGQ